MEQNHCLCWKVAGLRALVDYADIYSLIAPRFLQCQNGLKEGPRDFYVPLAREALKEMGRADLIGQRPDQLVPSYQPPGTGRAAGTKRPVRPDSRSLKFTTKGVPLPK